MRAAARIRRIAIVGAPGTGKSRLAAELAEALADPNLRIDDNPPVLGVLAHRERYAFMLLMGLDLPAADDGHRVPGPDPREAVDAQLRAALTQAGLPFQVVYGTGTQRLENALLALDRAAAARNPARAAGQAGRVPWSCENCSDPDCEHRLFTGLLARRT